MKKEEAISKGIEVEETQHSMKRRSRWHDYSQKGTYMLTLVVEGRMPLIGTLIGNAETSAGSPDRPIVEYSELGNTILKEEIQKIRHFYPMVEVWKECIMPDHIHLIVRVNEDMPKGKHLGAVVRGFKTGCSRAWWRILDSLGKNQGNGGSQGNDGSQGNGGSQENGGSQGNRGSQGNDGSQGNGGNQENRGNQGSGGSQGNGGSQENGGTATTVPSVSPEGYRPVLFEPGYNDKILMHDGQLANWKAYLDDNPRRLLVKRQHPDLFTVLYGWEIVGKKCQIIGNRFLLDIPDKVAVIVHRRYTEEENVRLTEEWLACGERGGVLVSAAISPKEKEVMRQAMNLGYRIILLRENGFPKMYKPSGESFNACSAGLLLQISPWEFHMERRTITRLQCLELNALAEKIANNEIEP